jgi:ABC-2 type transport system permease protein
MSLNKFLGPARVTLKEGFAYKFEFFAWTIIMPVTVLIFYFLWHSVFAYGGLREVRGMGFSDLITYYVLVLILSVLSYSSVTEDLAMRIRKGKFVIDLVQPMDVVQRYVSEFFGYKAIVLIVQVLPITIVTLILLRPQVSAINLVLFLISVVLASVMSFLIWFGVALLAFWMKTVNGVAMAVWGIVNILRGGLVPLVFFPHYVQSALNFLPFPYMMFVPIQIFLGKMTSAGAVASIGVQIFWIFVFLFVVRWVLSKGTRLFTGAGT